MGKTWQPVNIDVDTKNKLLVLKKGHSYDSLIHAMVEYFLVTGYDPFMAKNNPTMDMKKEVDRLIKIVKAQEKDYFKPMREMLNNVTGNGSIEIQSMTGEQQKNVSLPEGVSLEELQAIVERNQSLEEENKTLLDDFDNLRIENEKLKLKKSDTAGSNINSEVIEQSLQAILTAAKPNRLNPGLLAIDSNTLNSFVDRIKGELKKG